MKRYSIEVGNAKVLQAIQQIENEHAADALTSNTSGHLINQYISLETLLNELKIENASRGAIFKSFLEQIASLFSSLEPVLKVSSVTNTTVLSKLYKRCKELLLRVRQIDGNEQTMQSRILKYLEEVHSRKDMDSSWHQKMLRFINSTESLLS